MNVEIFQKLWALCDLALTLVLSKTTNYEMKEFATETRIPTMYFSQQPEHFVNTRVFLPPELQVRIALSFLSYHHFQYRLIYIRFYSFKFLKNPL